MVDEETINRWAHINGNNARTAYRQMYDECKANKRKGCTKTRLFHGNGAGNTFGYIMDKVIPLNERRHCGPETEEVIEVRLYGHPVVHIHEDGRVFGCDAGYETATTKRVLNLFGSVWQKDFVWYYINPETRQTETWPCGSWNRIN